MGHDRAYCGLRVFLCPSRARFFPMKWAEQIAVGVFLAALIPYAWAWDRLGQAAAGAFLAWWQ